MLLNATVNQLCPAWVSSCPIQGNQDRAALCHKTHVWLKQTKAENKELGGLHKARVTFMSQGIKQRSWLKVPLERASDGQESCLTYVLCLAEVMFNNELPRLLCALKTAQRAKRE